MSKVNLFKRAMATFLALAMFFTVLPGMPLQIFAEGDDAVVTAIAPLNKDTETGGQWIGNYGSDHAILLGYNYSNIAESLKGVVNFSNIGTNRFAFRGEGNSLQVDTAGYLSNLAISGGTANTIWAYSAAEGQPVLEHPSEGTAFAAYFRSGTDSVTTDNGGLDGYGYQSLSFEINDTDAHILSIYSDWARNIAGHILITDEDGNVLATDELEEAAFSGGVYLSYVISVKEAGKKVYIYVGSPTAKANGLAISGIFLDTLKSTAANLTAVPTTDSVVLGWEATDAKTICGTSVKIMRSEKDSGQWTEVAVVSNATSYTDTTVEAGKTYEYKIYTTYGTEEVEDCSAVVTAAGSGDEIVTATAPLNKDTETDGNWVNSYGSDHAILFGYKYPEADILTLTADRKGISANSYTLQIDNISSPYLTGLYIGDANLWAYSAINATTVLTNPNGTAFTAYRTSYSSSSPAVGGLDGYKYRDTYFTIGDTDTHILSIYSDWTLNKKASHILIVDEDNNILVSDELGTEEFSGGAYLSYAVSVQTAGKKIHVWIGCGTDNGLGISGIFLDTLKSTAANLTAVPTADSVVLGWEATGAKTICGTSVRIMRSVKNSGVWEELAVVSNAASYTDTTVKAGITYEYCIFTQFGSEEVLDCTAVATVDVYHNYTVNENQQVIDENGAPVDGNVITASGVLDLNGNSITVNVTGENTVLSVVDTSLIPENGANLTGVNAGKLTVTEGVDKIADWTQSGAYKYLKVDNKDGTYSFHPFNLLITRMGLNTATGHESVCLQVTFIADDVVRDLLIAEGGDYGLKLIKLNDEERNTVLSAKNCDNDAYKFTAEKNGVRAYFDLTDSLTNAKFDTTGEFKAYIKIGDQEIVSNYTAVITPRKVMEELNNNATINPTSAQKARIQALWNSSDNYSELKNVLTNFQSAE